MSIQELWRDASGRLTLDVSSVAAAEHSAICNEIAKAFSLIRDSQLIVGLDQMFWDFRRGEQVIGLDWDPWMGFMVVAKTPTAEPLVQEIAQWFMENRWGE